VGLVPDERAVQELAPYVYTQRSMNEFDRGDRAGVQITRVPFAAKTSSKTVVNGG
jgi:hypothetical protein